MAVADLTVEIRTRRVWVLRLANLGYFMPVAWHLRFANCLWQHVVFEIRSGREWHRLPQPELTMDMP